MWRGKNGMEYTVRKWGKVLQKTGHTPGPPSFKALIMSSLLS